MKPQSVKSKAYEYMARASKRFSRDHKHEGGPLADDCEFCNGFTYGAVDGYAAGYKAAMKQKRRARR